MQCVGTVADGWTIDIDANCAAETAEPGLCPTEFIGSEAQYGTTLPARSVLLGENNKCTIMVDSNQGTSRIAFSGSSELGVLYPGYVMGQPITVEKGMVKYITVFNGKQSGSVQFSVIFSGA